MLEFGDDTMQLRRSVSLEQVGVLVINLRDVVSRGPIVPSP